MLFLQIDLEDTFDPDKFSFHPHSYDSKPGNLPTSRESVHPESNLNNPVNAEKKTVKPVCRVSKTFFSVILDFC